MHYLQLDPSRSNLPKDSTGRIKGGPGHKKGAPNVLSRLSKDRIARVFEELGGVKGMYDWVRKNPKNEYAFYVHIWPKLLGAETVDAGAERLAHRTTTGTRSSCAWLAAPSSVERRYEDGPEALRPCPRS